MPKKKKSNASSRQVDMKLQIFAVLFFALSLFFTVVLVSELLGASELIFGPWFGRALAGGVFLLFGPVMSMLLPITLAYLGVQYLHSQEPSIKTLLILLGFLLMGTVLFAIPHMSEIFTNDNYTPPNNAIGSMGAYFFTLVFGTAVFGPYFFTITVLLILSVILFEIDVKEIVLSISHWLKSRRFSIALPKKRTVSETITISESSDTVPLNEPIAVIDPTEDIMVGQDSGEAQESPFPVGRDTADTPVFISPPINVHSDYGQGSNETVGEKSGVESQEVSSLTPTENETKKSAEIADVGAQLDGREIDHPEMDSGVSSKMSSKMSSEVVEAVEDVAAEDRSTPIIINNPMDSGVQTTEEHQDEDEPDISSAAVAMPSLLDENGGSVVPENSSGVVAEIEEVVIPPKPYTLPSIDIIPDPPVREDTINRAWIDAKSMVLIKTLDEFRLKGCRVSCVNPGPVVTQFEIQLAPGIQVKRIIALQDDIALKVGGKAIRIEAPIPGKAAVGIEIPNDTRDIVYYKDILNSPAFRETKAKLPVIIGTSISGVPLVEDISKMPHLLIAGQTGAGKSVGINSFIATLLLTKKPDELRMIMIDPKKVEMACYEGIPHLMSPVVTEPDKAVAALQWAVREMENRYRLLAKVGSKNLESFNNKCEDGKLQKFVDNESIMESEDKKLPYVVIIIDELADLMMTAAKDVEALVQRISQLARAVGIHLIVATQRPSVDIITGPIKANLTSRISFRTIQRQDSSTILGSVGAEKLLGMGDMLYLKNGAPHISRYHGAFISEEDVENLVDEIKLQGVEFNKIQFQVEPPAEKGKKSKGGGSVDDLFEDAARLIVSSGLGSVTGLQRRLEIGFARAGRIMDQLEDAGVVGPRVGSKPREVLISAEVLEDMFD